MSQAASRWRTSRTSSRPGQRARVGKARRSSPRVVSESTAVSSVARISPVHVAGRLEDGQQVGVVDTVLPRRVRLGLILACVVEQRGGVLESEPARIGLPGQGIAVGSVSGFLCNAQRYGRSAGTATQVRDRCGVYVAVEALAEDSRVDPMRVARAGGGNRVRHLATLVGCLGCPSRRTLTRRGDGHVWGGNLPSQGQQA